MKVNRNDLCPCGSGKKYKFCCWKLLLKNGTKFTKKDQLWQIALKQIKNNAINNLKLNNNLEIDSFINHMISRQTTNITTIFNIFKARGFLLELINDYIYISDNSHKDDKKFLDDLLNKLNIGYVAENRIHLHDNQSMTNWRRIFQIYNGKEALSYNNWSKWTFFKNRIHGKKICVEILDPFIANLVKSISAIGLITSNSCDGHFRRNAYVEFCGLYNFTWFFVIFQNFIRPQIELNCNWRFESNCCIIEHPERKFLDLYIEILDVSNLIYLNRMKLRAIKRNTVEKIDREIIDKKVLYNSFELNFKEFYRCI